MTITISGSMQFINEMIEVSTNLKSLGITNVYVPDIEGMKGVDRYLVSKEDLGKSKFENGYMIDHYNKIIKSDCLLVANYDKKGIKGYIGGNTFLEMGFAFVQNKPIFLLKPIPELSYTSEIVGMQPIVVNNDLSSIVEYYNNLEKVYVASESSIKTSAASFGMQKALRTMNVVGKKTDSGVSEQPVGLEETVTGCLNRLNNLKIQTLDPYKFLVSIESGLIKEDTTGNYFDIAYCVIEDSKGNQKVGLSSGLNIPNEIVIEVLEKDLDLGPLLMQKYGLKEKDPVIFYTKGKISRSKLLEDLVFQVASTF